jgi:hypothetical protein
VQAKMALCVPKLLKKLELIMMYQIANALRDNEIKDILTIGTFECTDADTLAQNGTHFSMYLEDIFLKLHSNIYVNISSSNNSVIRLSLVQVPTLRPSISVDEEDWCFGSLFRIFLDKEIPKNDVVLIRSWCKDDWNFELGFCDALELTLANGAILFFDPLTNLDEIKIGNIVLRDKWLENYKQEGSKSNAYVLNLEEWPIQFP